MSTKLGIQEGARKVQAMLCPCCGGRVLRGASECGCGAQFVGEPLDETPLKVQRLGPAMTSVALLVLVVVATLVITKWLAFAAVLVIRSGWRAVKLAKQDAEWYGGYKTAVGTLSLAIAGSAALAAYGIAHIPRAIENYHIRQIAATQASMHHLASLLENYRLSHDSYPSSQEFKKILGESLPTDYWDSTIKYEPTNGPIADRSISITLMSSTNFELRSAGPDGVVDTDDDIIMRDGVFFTSAEIKKQTVVQQLR